MIKTLLKSVREYKRASILAPVIIGMEVVMECILPLLMARLINQMSGDSFTAIVQTGAALVIVAMISLACGVYTLLPDEGGEFSPMMLDYLAEEARTDNPRLEVKENITKDYPPTFIFSAYLDSLYEACEPMAEFLRSRGVEVRCKIYGSPEAEDVRHVFHVNMKLPEGERANRDQTAFFTEHIR